MPVDDDPLRVPFLPFRPFRCAIVFSFMEHETICSMIEKHPLLWVGNEEAEGAGLRDRACDQVDGVRLMQPATVRTKSWEVSGFTRYPSTPRRWSSISELSSRLPVRMTTETSRSR